MYRHPGFIRPAPSLVALLALACLAVFAGSCSSKSSTPTAVVTGPTFDFTFPTVGESHQFQFTTAGSFPYHCVTHASFGMTGTVIVDPSSIVDSALVAVGPSGALQFQPASVTIKPNGFVRWVNQNSTIPTHTVTRP